MNDAKFIEALISLKGAIENKDSDWLGETLLECIQFCTKDQFTEITKLITGFNIG